MLPKEEKIKKTSDEKQPGLFDKEDEKKRLAKKRKFIYFAMLLTIGLSLCFWIYRLVKNFDFNFKLPKLSFTTNTTKSSSVKTNTDLNIPKDNATWSIFLQQDNFNGIIIYQKNQDLIFINNSLDSIHQQLDQSDYIESSPYISSLPKGLKIKEIIIEDDLSFSYFAKIKNPDQELFLAIKITDSKNLIESKNLISDLVGQMYWYSLQK